MNRKREKLSQEEKTHNWETDKHESVGVPGQGDGLSSTRTRAAECAGTESILWAPAQGGRTAGRSRGTLVLYRPDDTLKQNFKKLKREEETQLGSSFAIYSHPIVLKEEGCEVKSSEENMMDVS